MNPTELKELARTFEGIADGRQWQIRHDTATDWREAECQDPLHYIGIGTWQIRLKPWELGRTVNGHTLPEGAEWHRQDFTEDMLPAPYRPIMLNESGRDGMESIDNADNGIWKSSNVGQEAQKHHFHRRTTRPIPAPEPQWVPLGPEDVPPFSVIRRKGQTDEYDNLQYWHWRLISYVTGIGPVCADRGYNWQELSTDYEINRPRNRDTDGNPTLWEPCRKQSNS